MKSVCKAFTHFSGSGGNETGNRKVTFPLCLTLTFVRREAFLRLALDDSLSTVLWLLLTSGSTPLPPVSASANRRLHLGSSRLLVNMASRQPDQGSLVPLSSRLVVSLSRALLSLRLVRLVVSLVPGTRVPCCHHVFQ